ncbi:MAG: hypothetical protein ACRDPC_05065 [Solirubrobacteraceae bacterium]
MALGLGSFWAPPAHADAEPGDRDTSFGGDGIVTTAFTSFGGAFATDIAIRNNRIAAVGGDGGGRFALGIYNLDGSLRFDRVTTNFGGDDRANAVAFTPLGKIVAAGATTPSGGAPRFALARYFGFGTIDMGFGGDGTVTTAINRGAIAHDVALQDDGKIVAAGQVQDENFVGSLRDLEFALARYNADGSLDRSFDGNGIRVVDFDSSDESGPSDHDVARAVAIQPDGRIVAVGRQALCGDPCRLRFAVTRHNLDGSLDITFDGDGKLRTTFAGVDASARAVALQPDGKIVAAGEAGGGFALTRYNTNGSLDTSFGGDGRVASSIGVGNDRAEAVAIQGDGKIVAAGRTAEGGGNVAIARYLPGGALDPTFGDAGRVITGIGGDESASGIALQGAGTLPDDGKIVIAGETSSGDGRFLLARYHAEAFDTTPPNTAIISSPADPTNDPEPSFGLGSSEPGSSFECELDRAGFEPCSSPHVVGPLADGAHTLRARATDEAGNADPTPASRSFTVDTTPPETTISGPGGTIADPAPSFGLGSSEPGSSFQCELDGAGFEPCSSPHAIGPLPDGAHALRTRATDQAGNTDPTPASRGFTVDTSPRAGRSPSPGNPSEGSPSDGSPTDTTVAIRIKRKRLPLRKRRLVARLACPRTEASGPCRGRIVVKTRAKVRFGGKLRRVKLAAARFSIETGETGRVRARLGKKPRRVKRIIRLLGNEPRARRVKTIARVRDAAGNRARVVKKQRIRVR